MIVVYDPEKVIYTAHSLVEAQIKLVELGGILWVTTTTGFHLLAGWTQEGEVTTHFGFARLPWSKIQSFEITSL